jgi:aryl-alcohol dehydrogenase-like predicted oxidoreductase
MLSVLGFGGLVLKFTPPENVGQVVRSYHEAGVNYFDVAPKYGDAEELLGPEMPAIRETVFLSCKTAQRSRAGATGELERSLKRLRTDRFDLYQLHHVTSMKDVDTIFAEGGAMEALIEARKSGKARYLGFSAHSVEAAMALMDRFDFDTIMFPVNIATWFAGEFGPQVLERAHQKQMGILALKAMAKGPWAKDADRSVSPAWYEPTLTPEDALKGIRFALSHPVTSFLQPHDPAASELALQVTPQFTPMNVDEIEVLKRDAVNRTPMFRYPQQQQQACVEDHSACDGIRLV